MLIHTGLYQPVTRPLLHGKGWRSLDFNGEYCLDGITRRKVLEICDSHGIPYTLGNFTFDDVHLAERP